METDIGERAAAALLMATAATSATAIVVNQKETIKPNNL